MASEPTGTVSAELAKQLTDLAEEENVAHDLYVLANKLESGANRGRKCVNARNITRVP